MITTVYLVGAGPGDCGLLTLRAKQLLEQANAVIYDALVSPAIMNLCAKSARLIYVGKRAGNHSNTQEEINQIIIETARQTPGGKVVRLKGGDPFVFGRGGEEMAALKAAGLVYEIVPGVTAGISAPAYFGIPVTHRGMSRSVSLITAATQDGNLPDLNWDALARLDGTLVFYMGMRAVPQICRRLIAYGMNANQQAAIISRGTTARQLILTSDLAHFTPDYADYEALSPGLFVVGDVVSFADKYGWSTNQPLAGQKIIVTRSLAQASDLSVLLEEKGAEVVLLPTIEIVPSADLTALSAEIKRIQNYSWLLFTSVNAVEIFFGRLQTEGLDARALSKCKVGAVGAVTEQCLRHFGIRADFVPTKHTGRDFAHELLQHDPEIRGNQVLIPSSAIAHTEIREILEQSGVQCLQLPVYENRVLTYEQNYLEDLLTGKCDWLTFCSSSAVDNFMHLIRSLGLEHLLHGIKIAVIGHVTAQALSQYNLNHSAMPANPTLKGLVNEIVSKSH